MEERIKRWIKRCVGLFLLLGLLLFSSGCLENTMTGLGKAIQGTGELVSGVGKDVVRGSVGYAKER